MDDEIIEEVEEYKYLGQITSPSQQNDLEINQRIRAAWSCFGQSREIFQDEEMPINRKKKMFNVCIIPALTYGWETWALTKQH